MSIVLQARDLHKEYGVDGQRTPVLRGLSLEIGRGEFVAIMGPSGCGKTTLLMMLGCLARPTRGTVTVDGEEVASASEQKRTRIRQQKIGFVFQRFNLLPTLTVQGNLELSIAIRGVKGYLPKEEMLARVGLADKGGSRPRELSMGEQQRVAVVRALIHRPALVLADEPTGSLDSANARAILSLMKELNEEFQQTIVMVTHDQEAASYADRIIRMCDGRIVN